MPALHRHRLTSLFLISVVIIAYQLAVMRVFAVGSWSTFGSLVISIALLGNGLAGTLLTFLSAAIRRQGDTWLKVTSIALGPAMVLAHVLAQLVPFNPVLIATDTSQLWWIGVYYLVYALPFFAGALYIGVVFVVLSDQVHRLYFWNMAGSGIGGFVILGLMYLLPPGSLILPLLVLVLAVSLLSCVTVRDGLYRLGLTDVLACVFVFGNSVVLLALAGDIRVSPFKGISYARQFPDAREVHYSYGPTGEMHVYESSFFHFAPGLSDNASLNLATMPEKAFLGLYIDGGGPIGIMRKLSPNEERYIDYLPMSAPYPLLRDPKVLLLRLGGGIGAYTALYHGARRVTIAESNPALVRMLRDDPVLRRFTGDLLRDPRVELRQDEPRAFVRSTGERYDLVELGLIDSVGLSQTGGYPVEENYTYTVEGIRDYLDVLAPGGLLSITVWNRLSPPRNVPKLLTTVSTALTQRGAESPGRRMFVFHLLFSTATVLVKESDFTQSEIDALLAYARRMSFEVVWHPGMETRPKDFERILAEYTTSFLTPQLARTEAGADGGAATGPSEPPVDLLPGDLYHFVTQWMNSGKAAELYREYIFDIRPATDNRPYYTAYLKPATVGVFLDQLAEVAEEWGYVLLLGTFLQSLLFGALIIVIPLVGRRRDLGGRPAANAGVIVYYACLGLAYMAVEIFLMQRLVFFLSEPIFSTSVVISAMLVISGLGSLTGGKLAMKRQRLLWVAAGGIVASMLAYVLVLPGILSALIGLPLAVKMAVSVVVIAPAAFFMGIPFPTGLSSLAANRPAVLPWAWGMNGALSVTGAALARLLSVQFGYAVVLLIVAGLYLVAAAIYRSNEARPAEARPAEARPAEARPAEVPRG